MSTITYDLQDPIEYAFEGETHNARIIVLSAPSSKNRNECFKIKQLFMRALKDQRSMRKEMSEADLKRAEEAIAAKKAEKEDGADEEGLDGSEVMQMIGMSSVSLGETVELTRGLLCVGSNAMVDNSTALTPTLADRLSLDDLEGVVGAYLAGFILKSVLESLSES